jgi:hypothetical protein
MNKVSWLALTKITPRKTVSEATATAVQKK